jgi:hypothetical protein
VLTKAKGDAGEMPSVAGATHTPLAPSQVRFPAQSSPAAQVRHCVGLLHWVLWHGVIAGIVQSPRTTALHTDAGVKLPPAQLAGTHTFSVPG